MTVIDLNKYILSFKVLDIIGVKHSQSFKTMGKKSRFQGNYLKNIKRNLFDYKMKLINQ